MVRTPRPVGKGSSGIIETVQVSYIPCPSSGQLKVTKPTQPPHQPRVHPRRAPRDGRAARHGAAASRRSDVVDAAEGDVGQTEPQARAHLDRPYGVPADDGDEHAGVYLHTPSPKAPSRQPSRRVV